MNWKCNPFNTNSDPVYEVCVPTQIVHRNVYGESVRVYGEANNVYEVGVRMSGEGVPTPREGDFAKFDCFQDISPPVPALKSTVFLRDVVNSFALLRLFIQKNEQ